MQLRRRDVVCFRPGSKQNPETTANRKQNVGKNLRKI